MHEKGSIARERRARRRLARQGFMLVKQRQRDPLLPDRGYMIAETTSRFVIAGERHVQRPLALGDVETWIAEIGDKLEPLTPRTRTH